jgi:GNAT superfamily N-acetyltransferase
VEIASLGFRTDLLVLELGGSEIEHHEEHVVVRTPANPTYWWGNFVLFAEPVGADELAGRLELFADAFPYAEHVAWGIDSTDGTAGDEAALIAEGFEVSRDAVLTATEVRPPARGVAADVRPLRGDGDWRQAFELHVACADRDDEAVTEEFLGGQVAAARMLTDIGHATWFGAFGDRRLLSSLGIVSDGSGLARFQTVETHPDARRRGLASALVHHAGQTALRDGATRLVIVADPDYHAIDIYRSLGFAETETTVQLTRRPASMAS